ncbi:hypothetical protein FXO38_31059 [Capsicum annuum]|nr:hypothetical protein FXO38_31059 [Capsicum annuum]KAF3639974.1 hypothetical protein FXO37_23733 [Capsicum annuum]
MLEMKTSKRFVVPLELQFERFPPAVNTGCLIYFKLKDDEDNKAMGLNYDGKRFFQNSLFQIPLDECTGYYPHNQLVEYKKAGVYLFDTERDKALGFGERKTTLGDEEGSRH